VDTQTKNTMLHLAGATMIGMPVVALIIDYFSDSLDLRERIFIGDPLWKQVCIGLVVGLVAGFLAGKISEMKFMEKVSQKYTQVFETMNLSTSQVIFISLSAGFGEEILFRGALQFFFGIYFTAILFVAVHGYLNPKDWRISIYGVFMTLVIIGFGHLTDYFGIWTAIVAHAVVDMYLLKELVNQEKT